MQVEKSFILYSAEKDCMNFESFFWGTSPSGYQGFGQYPQLLSEFLEYPNFKPKKLLTINSGLLYADTYGPHSEIIYDEACIHL